MRKLKKQYNGIRTDILVEHWKDNLEQYVFQRIKELDNNPLYVALFQLMHDTRNEDWIMLNEYTDSIWRNLKLYGGNDTLRLRPEFTYEYEEDISSMKKLFKKYFPKAEY